MKKVLATILSLALATSVGVALVACGGDNNKPNGTTCTQHVDTNPKDGKCDNCGKAMSNEPGKTVLSEAELLKGVWETPQYGDASHALKDYVAFHEGGIFYWRAQGDKNPSAGNYTFTLETGNVTNTIDPSNGDAYTINVEGWVTLTTFKGEPVVPTGDTFQDGKYPIAYDADEKQYVLFGIHYGDMRFTHVPDRTHSYDDEDPITIASYSAAGSTVQKVELGHNGKYTDMATGDYYEGSWSYNATTKTYTLTDDDGSTATIVESANGAFGAYKRGETELELNNDDFKAETILKFEGSLAAAGGASCELLVYNNNKYDLYVNGSLNANGSGTWTKDGDNYVFASTAVNATTVYEGGKYSVTVMGSTLEEVKAAAAVFTLGGTITITPEISATVEAVLYDDGSAVITTSAAVIGVSVEETGTYTNDGNSIKITIPVEDGDDKEFTATNTNGAYAFKYAVTLQVGANSREFTDIDVSTGDIAMRLTGETPVGSATGVADVVLYGSLATGGGEVIVVTQVKMGDMALSTVITFGTWALNPDYSIKIDIGEESYTATQVAEAAQGTYGFDYETTLSVGTNSMPATITVTRVMPTAE